MQIQKEKVLIEPGRSFRIFSPSLKNYFYWHYHPEFELIYIEGLTGIRHVGQHISNFMDSDLVLIGSNVPHLNFDYGLQTEYHQIVVQIKEDFPEKMLAGADEFALVEQLFSKARYGISFKGETKAKAAQMLKEINSLDNFERLMKLMEIFQLLALSNDGEQLNDHDTSVSLYLNDKLRISTIYDYIHKHYQEQTDVNVIADRVGLSTAAFCRYFKRQTNMTFTDFVNQYRINQAMTMLLKDITVSEACYSVGFKSLSYFNKLFNKLEGMGPMEFKKRFTKG
ncbi:AraC family transcriptional regulator [Mucilaginibacter conchicola]|uniref:AraC family transcriptional regulator n=1 Tax=Mucilaginibacter conchicola TaxID=2303333 RepID=A0A372NXD4_9SPHI|nr:AraC family transcriptional regulator [Mucilaginibacter conchicola]RFZ94776.1 AraC family transcriptional regulator [Mucilaginibacter conchicola]